MASASKLWPRPRPQPRGFGFGLASITLSYYVIGHFLYKNRVIFGNFVNFSGNNLKSYVLNHYLVLFHNYFCPRPRPHSPGLGLVALASASASRFWPRLTSLVIGDVKSTSRHKSELHCSRRRHLNLSPRNRKSDTHTLPHGH